MEEPPVSPPTEVPLPPAQSPIMDVVAPPPEEIDPKDPPTKPAPPAKPEATPKPKPPKPPGHGVTTAIIATVIIVLGLASLAVYAYLQQKK